MPIKIAILCLVQIWRNATKLVKILYNYNPPPLGLKMFGNPYEIIYSPWSWTTQVELYCWYITCLLNVLLSLSFLYRLFLAPHHETYLSTPFFAHCTDCPWNKDSPSRCCALAISFSTMVVAEICNTHRITTLFSDAEEILIADSQDAWISLNPKLRQQKDHYYFSR